MYSLEDAYLLFLIFLFALWFHVLLLCSIYKFFIFSYRVELYDSINSTQFPHLISNAAFIV